MKATRIAMLAGGIVFGVFCSSFIVHRSSLLLAQPTQPTGDSAALEDVADRMANAMVKKDAGYLEGLLGENFSLTDAAGNVMDKTDMLRQLKDGSYEFKSVTVNGPTVRRYGDAAAVVIGEERIAGTFKGRDVTGVYRFTDTFVRGKSGDWQAAAAQLTMVAPPPASMPATTQGAGK